MQSDSSSGEIYLHVLLNYAVKISLILAEKISANNVIFGLLSVHFGQYPIEEQARQMIKAIRIIILINIPQVISNDY